MSIHEDKKQSILFVYTGLSSFVQNDLDILSSVHSVDNYHFKPVRGLLRNALEAARQFFYLLVFGWKYDLVYCWFADYHSFLPVLFARVFRKRSVVVIGGYDVCRIRTLNYGAFCSPFRGWFSAGSMKLASVLAPVSEYVERKVKVIAPKAKTKMIYNCVSLKNRKRQTQPKNDSVLTVGLINTERTFYLKGIDTYIETARLLPGIRFDIVGIDQEKLEHKLGNLPVNLKLYNRVGPEDLADFYQRSKIYCQLSRSESFGVSIAEAMSFGCFPVVTNEGGMPEVVGSEGAIVPRDPQFIANLIKNRLLKDGGPGEEEIRMHIHSYFSVQQRALSILSLVDPG